MNTEQCPCGSGKHYQDCCEPAHLGKVPAATCEALMRSRYSAYALQLTNYLVKTTHPKSRSKMLKPQIEASHASTQWLGLSIGRTQQGGESDKVGKVEFVAHFKEKDNQQQVLHELSRFARYEGQWVYLDGELL